MISKLFIAIVIFPICVSAQLPTAKNIAGKMKVGWNLGNTLEAICGETAWGGAVTTQRLIDSVKAAGFNSVRIPCAWFCHADTVNSVIDESWMNRVKQVVDYCIKDSLFVVLNMHWDKGWLENRINKANQKEVNSRLQKYWTQIANNFKNYDEHLLFAGANEPAAKDSAATSVLLSYYQTFINAVRATGGNNSSRTLIIQGPETNIEKTNKWMNELPVDKIENRLMMEIHYYDPYQFCLMEKDAEWGKRFFYWGKNNHSKTDSSYNATWGEESSMEEKLEIMKQKFADKGVPVIIGEFGAYKRKLPAGADKKLHDASVEYFQQYFVKTAVSKGLIPFYWDINMGLFDRGKCKVLDENLLHAIMNGANEK
ncbi:MAG TPA: glycoside hydrolase family 5 protein [Chitinophagaceae bacterium]|nr:glycoside hydrolase family 5 protein [Chitinophagaceae bacterium]